MARLAGAGPDRGAFAGVVEAAAAGARRTDAAYPSLLAWSDAPDVLLFSFAGASRTFGRFPSAARRPSPGAPVRPPGRVIPVASPAAAQVIAPESMVVPSHDRGDARGVEVLSGDQRRA